MGDLGFMELVQRVNDLNDQVSHFGDLIKQNEFDTNNLINKEPLLNNKKLNNSYQKIDQKYYQRIEKLANEYEKALGSRK